jgi:AraC-like DNA-binding protein
MNMPLVVIASWIHAVVDQMETFGIDRTKLIGESRKLAGYCMVPNAHFELAVARRVWHRASELSQDPLLGLKVGKKMPLQAMNALSIILMHSADVRTAFANLDRYEGLVGNSGHFVSEGITAGVRLIYRATPCHVPLHYMQADSVITALLRFLRLSGLADLAPRHVALSSPHADLKADYESFFRCPVSFGEDEASIVLDKSTLDRLLPNADPSLLELARIHAEAMLTRQKTLDGLAQSVRAILGARQFTEVSCNDVAKNLGISHRTLQRRLAEVGHTFRDLLEAARMEEAFHLLTQSSLPLSQIAYKLGYSEPSSFSRAVRNWFGLSPGQQRKEAHISRKNSSAPSIARESYGNLLA